MKIITKSKIRSELIESKTKSGWQFTWTDGLNRFYTEHYDGCSKVEARKQFVNLVYSKTV